MAKFLLSDFFIGNYGLSQKWGARPEVYAQFGQAGHNGWDYIMPNGTQVIAPADGVCILVAEERKDGELVGFGRYCKILHEQNGEFFVTVYGHLQSVEVTKDQKIKKFQLIAKSDNNGFSSAPHLHFGIYLSDAQGNKLEKNDFGGYHDPADKKIFEWKTESPTKPYEPTQSETMGVTEDAQRALKALEEYRIAANHGNLEGAVNALLGTLRDLTTAQKDIIDIRKQLDTVKNDLRDRDSFISGQNETIKTLQKQQLDLVDILSIPNDYPTLKGEIQKLIGIEDDNSVLRSQLAAIKNTQGEAVGKIVAEWEARYKLLERTNVDLVAENTQLKAKRNLDKFTDGEKIWMGITLFFKKIGMTPVNAVKGVGKGIASVLKKLFRRGGDKNE